MLLLEIFRFMPVLNRIFCSNKFFCFNDFLGNISKYLGIFCRRDLGLILWLQSDTMCSVDDFLHKM